MGAKKKEALEQFNRDNILTAAGELFASKGVEKTTMDDIALHADYSKSTIYVYFRSKEDIYNSILEQRYADLLLDIAKIDLERGDIVAAYHNTCRCLVDFQKTYPKYFASLMGESKTTNSRKYDADEGRQGKRDMVGVFKPILLYGIESKAFRQDIDVDKTALYMWTAIGGIIQYSGRKENAIKNSIHITREEYLEFCFTQMYNSLRIEGRTR